MTGGKERRYTNERLHANTILGYPRFYRVAWPKHGPIRGQYLMYRAPDKFGRPYGVRLGYWCADLGKPLVGQYQRLDIGHHAAYAHTLGSHTGLPVFRAAVCSRQSVYRLWAGGNVPVAA